MSEPENFVARWSRLKRLPAEKKGGAHAEAAAEPQAGEASESGFDLASLPSIEAITKEVDIRGFLRSGVPAALATEALRRAWASDPDIRDFIGIAENQWNFNDPASIPGFGDSTAGVELEGAVEKLWSGVSKATAGAATPSSLLAGNSDGAENTEENSVEASEERAPDLDAETSTARAHDAAQPDRPAVRRSHGGALPR